MTRIKIFQPPFFLATALLLAGCDAIQSFLPPSSTAPANTLVYDAPVSLTIKKDSLLPGTTIAYGGRTETGAAKVLLAGVIAPKKIADTLDWEGAPVANTKVKLTTRVISFDDNALTVGGTARIELNNISIQPGGAAGTVMLEFAAPVSYTLIKGQAMPGSNIAFVGMSADGAQFAGLQGFAFRKQLDSLEYDGRILPKVYLRLDLRVISFSADGAVLGGTANIKLEAP